MSNEQTNGGPMPLAKIEPVAALARHAEIAATRQLEPSNADEAFQIAKILAASNTAKNIRTPEQAFAILATGRELGLGMMASLRSIYFYDGKPSMAADLMVALCRRSPLCKSFVLKEYTSTKCVYLVQRTDEAEPMPFEFTIEDAKIAGLLGKDNWKKYPKQMLRARCGADAARTAFPEVLAGVYDHDEIGPSEPQRVPAYDVIHNAPPPADSGPSEASGGVDVDAIMARLAECETVEAVNKLASSPEVKASTGDARKALAAAFKARREALQAEAAA